MEDAAAAWNIGSEQTDRVDGDQSITSENIDEIVTQAMGGRS